MNGTKTRNFTPGSGYNRSFGFTIENIDQYLPDFNSDALLLGWLFKFADNDATAGRQMRDNITQITIHEIRLSVADGMYVMNEPTLLGTPGNSPNIIPVMHVQVDVPETAAVNADYMQLLNQNESKYYEVDDTDGAARIDDLEAYKCWVDAAFIRATDLRLLKAYIQNQEAGYHDVYFSGATLNYNSMHNARLRVEQYWFPLKDDCINTGKGSGGNLSFANLGQGQADTEDEVFTKDGVDYLMTSKSFTLKAEPILIGDTDTSDRGTDVGDDGGADSGGGASASAEGTDGETGINGMLPAAFLMVSCPKYWDVMRAINEEAIMATDGAYQSVPTFDPSDPMPNSLGAMLNTSVGTIGELPLPTDPSSGTALASLLRALADFIDNLFADGNGGN